MMIYTTIVEVEVTLQPRSLLRTISMTNLVISLAYAQNSKFSGSKLDLNAWADLKKHTKQVGCNGYRAVIVEII